MDRHKNYKQNIKVHNRLRDLLLKPYPIKQIKPQGWLRRQLEIHASGMGGQLDTFWPSLQRSRWIGGYIPDEKDPVDNMIYWLDGIIPMAWQLDDKGLQEKCHKYVNAILFRQWENGWICPDEPEKNDLPDTESFDEKKVDITSAFTEGWALFGILKVLIQYYEATGDERIPVSIENALRFMDSFIDENTIRNWGSTRWSEGLISIFWLYERTHEEWLIHLAKKIKCQGFDWVELYSDEETWPYAEPLAQGHWSSMNHVVNNAMAIKSGALYSRLSKKKDDYISSKRMLNLIDKYHGMVTGMFSGDENFSGNEPIQGSELCAVVEFMYSLEQLISITGDIDYADRLEMIAFNCLPAAFNHDMTAHQCVQQVNQVECSKQEWPVFSTVGPEANLFGVEPFFPCCTTQTQGWPKYLQSLFMQAEDGIAVISYAPAKLETEICGKEISVDITGRYPFSDEVKISVEVKDKVPFALYLRIPGWVKNAAVSIDNESYSGKMGTYLKINRVWVGKADINIMLPTEYKFIQRPNKLSALVHGPLVYSLPIGEKWIKQDKPEAKEMPWLNNWEVFSTTDWNFGIISDTHIDVVEKNIGEYPFSPDGAPIEVYVKGKQVEWDKDRGSATVKPSMNWVANEENTIKLIPYGCTNLRITEMPIL